MCFLTYQQLLPANTETHQLMDHQLTELRKKSGCSLSLDSSSEQAMISPATSLDTIFFQVCQSFTVRKGYSSLLPTTLLISKLYPLYHFNTHQSLHVLE